MRVHDSERGIVRVCDRVRVNDRRIVRVHDSESA